MKQAIEKAIEQGMTFPNVPQKYNKLNNDYKMYESEHDDRIVFILKNDNEKSEYFKYKKVNISIYRLIFGTDFIDKLVGKPTGCHKKSCSAWTDKKSSLIMNNCDYICDDRGAFWDRYTCDAFVGVKPVEYYLKQMSNPKISRDPEKLKEYVRKLI
jgi:hypothetical protein